MIRAIQIRNMNSGIHELFQLKPKTNAKLGIAYFNALNTSEDHYESSFIWGKISEFTEPPVEINFRNYETNERGNKYFLVNGQKIFVVNKNHIDIWF